MTRIKSLIDQGENNTCGDGKIGNIITQNLKQLFTSNLPTNIKEATHVVQGRVNQNMNDMLD